MVMTEDVSPVVMMSPDKIKTAWLQLEDANLYARNWDEGIESMLEMPLEGVQLDAVTNKHLLYRKMGEGSSSIHLSTLP